MTNKEVKDNFVQNLAENAYINMCSVEEMEIAIKALEKQIPKKPIEARRWLYDNGLICPVCSCSIYKLSFSYCPNCGQKIDWEE